MVCDAIHMFEVPTENSNILDLSAADVHTSILFLALEGIRMGGGQSDHVDFFGLKFLFLDRLPKSLAQLLFVC